jgi:hypothetical protein
MPNELAAKSRPSINLEIDSLADRSRGLFAFKRTWGVTPANCQMIIAAGQGATAAQSSTAICLMRVWPLIPCGASTAASYEITPGLMPELRIAYESIPPNAEASASRYASISKIPLRVGEADCF